MDLSNRLRLSHRIRHLYIPMIVLLIFQCYVTLIEFPQAYGTKAIILGPVRSGSIFIGMYCYYAAFTHHYKSTVHTSWLTVLIVNLTTQCIVYLLCKLSGLLFIMHKYNRVYCLFIMQVIWTSFIMHKMYKTVISFFKLVFCCLFKVMANIIFCAESVLLSLRCAAFN